MCINFFFIAMNNWQKQLKEEGSGVGREDCSGSHVVTSAPESRDELLNALGFLPFGVIGGWW